MHRISFGAVNCPLFIGRAPALMVIKIPADLPPWSVSSKALLACLLLQGCHSLPSASESWAAVNTVHSARTVPHPGEALNAPRLLRLTVSEALDTLVPASFQIDVAHDLDPNTVINVDTTKNWLEALGQGLYEADMEFITNLYSKSATISWNRIALAQVIKTYLPADFTVYSNAGINLQSPFRFNTRQYWAQALSVGAVENGIVLTIDYGDKIISLRPADDPVRLPVRRDHAPDQSLSQSLASFSGNH